MSIFPLLAYAFFSVAYGAAYDPKLTWRTLKTPHFNIHFHGGEEQLAQEMSIIVEDVHNKMVKELKWAPNAPTELVLVDNTDSANGYASYLPSNTIVIFVTAPEGASTLGLYEDWNDGIFTHEYTHILHMDTVGGLPKLVRKIFGRIIALNGLAPSWVIEGQATLQETRYTNAGRGRSALVDMIKRTAVLQNQFPPLGNLDGYQTNWPGGNLRYLFGQDFMQYISDHYGRDVWTDWNHLYGQGVPYLLPSKKALGSGIPKLYKEWKQHLDVRYQKQKKQVEANTISQYEILTDTKRSCMGARLSPNGERLVYACSDLYTGSKVYVAERSRKNFKDPKVEMSGIFASDFSWRADSDAFVFSGMRAVNQFNFYSDIYLHNLQGKGTMLTRAKRARDPSFRRDGKDLLVVTNDVQNNQLATLSIDQDLQILTNNKDHTQYDNPVFSPDNKHIAVSSWHDGRRDLWLLNAKGKRLRRLTNDVAMDLQPQWSADGKTLYFSSDRSGIFNVYAIDLASENLYQVTNVLTGAFAPSISPDENELFFTCYHSNGYGVARMKLKRKNWVALGLLPNQLEYDAPLQSTIPTTPLIPLPKSTTKLKYKKKAKKRSKKQEKKSKNDKLLTEQLRYDGLTGIGGAFHLLQNEKGYWGRPHEKQSWGGAPDRQPDIENEINITTGDREESEFKFTYPVNRYSPIKSLIPPRFISPSIYRSFYGLLFNLGTAGTDTLRRHLYGAGVSYRTGSGHLGWNASYSYNRYIPIYSFGTYSYTVPYGDVYLYQQPQSGSWIPTAYSSNQQYWDRRIRSYAQVSYALGNARSIFLRWSGMLRSPWLPDGDQEIAGIPFRFGNKGLPSSAYRPLLPTRGFLSSIGGGWRFARGFSYARSVSTEKARMVSLVGELHSPYIGSFILDDTDQALGFTQLQMTAEWREYRPLPWGRNHVIAMKMATGATTGDQNRYGSYRLGGSFGESGYYTLPDEWRSLRGYSPASVYGNNYYLGSLEYRLPIKWIDRGYRTWPLFFRYISASAFVDVGNAYDEFTSISARPLVGVGAELYANVVISWGQLMHIRSGYAFAPAGDGVPLGSLSGFYLWLGNSF